MTVGEVGDYGDDVQLTLAPAESRKIQIEFTESQLMEAIGRVVVSLLLNQTSPKSPPLTGVIVIRGQDKSFTLETNVESVIQKQLINGSPKEAVLPSVIEEEETALQKQLIHNSLKEAVQPSLVEEKEEAVIQSSSIDRELVKEEEPPEIEPLKVMNSPIEPVLPTELVSSNEPIELAKAKMEEKIDVSTPKQTDEQIRLMIETLRNQMRLLAQSVAQEKKLLDTEEKILLLQNINRQADQIAAKHQKRERLNQIAVYETEIKVSQEKMEGLLQTLQDMKA